MDKSIDREMEHHGAELSFKDNMSYGDYLKLSDVLGAQAPLTDAHDELLFIIQHQTAELWMKLAIREMSEACDALAQDEFAQASKLMARVNKIFYQLNSAWDILRTMTPSDYTTFRDSLGKSSGFQSYQYRAIEFVVGNKNPALMKPHDHLPEVSKWLREIYEAPGIYDQMVRAVARAGFDISKDVLNRDVTRPYTTDASVQKAWAIIYRNPRDNWHFYDLAEKLIDFEDFFRRWRFNHLTTVERIIGSKMGTGGTSGAPYLKKMLDTVLFPELWQVRSDL
ncbi:Tryptophan 2,3-dioxygenase [Pseudovibrio axinellae]|uniref:Tryptophan 2,3-dioxygenase n=1 Tax=Pseudovibrio axinellae TaxID=989403 RepID=A0A165ZRU9_9HYPH|nr:tryptophan 2,3-dioxygenase [Pseudovibrio axinellae]KZL20213.1 Tryptophan 2,3-dioxygenase [Pseudovibrio axinellae]SEQ61219.1 tryptophan 2,3-dioxygenase [Pseudovibrio axinellae]